MNPILPPSSPPLHHGHYQHHPHSTPTPAPTLYKYRYYSSPSPPPTATTTSTPLLLLAPAAGLASSPLIADCEKVEVIARRLPPRRSPAGGRRVSRRSGGRTGGAAQLTLSRTMRTMSVPSLPPRDTSKLNSVESLLLGSSGGREAAAAAGVGAAAAAAGVGAAAAAAGGRSLTSSISLAPSYDFSLPYSLQLFVQNSSLPSGLRL